MRFKEVVLMQGDISYLNFYVTLYHYHSEVKQIVKGVSNGVGCDLWDGKLGLYLNRSIGFPDDRSINLYLFSLLVDI
jgi:hypothetical protein